MPSKLSEKAKEGSTYIIEASFYEVTPTGKSPVTPNGGLTWSLCDIDGNTINSRDDVPIIVVAPTIYIVLKDNDLALTGGSVKRTLSLKGTYDSIYGNDLPLIDEVEFQVSDLRGEP